MKQIFSLLVLLMLVGLGVCADEINGGFGPGFSARFNTEHKGDNALLGLRLSVWSQFVFEVNENVFLGPEIGVRFMRLKLSDGQDAMLSEWPIFFVAGYKTGIFRIEGLLGPMFTMDTAYSAYFSTNASLGARFSVGPVWLLASLVYNFGYCPSDEHRLYPSFGLGYRRTGNTFKK